MKRQRSRVRTLKHQSELQEMLLAERSTEIAELQTAWTLDPAHLHRVRNLAAGAFGEVEMLENNGNDNQLNKLHFMTSGVAG